MQSIIEAKGRDRWPRACEWGDELWACINCGEFFDSLKTWLV